MTGNKRRLGTGSSLSTARWRGLRHGVAASVLTFGLVGAVLAPPAFAAPSSESAHYVDEAKSLSSKGDIAAAIIQLKNAVRSDADNSDARYQLALLYLRSNDPGAAQRELESARARGFDENKLVAPLTQAYLQQGHYDEVIKAFDPDKYQGAARATVLVAKARAYLALNDAANAHKMVDIALKEAPDQPDTLIADAMVLRAGRDLKGAEAQVDKALAKEPDQVDYLILKGELRQQQGDPAGAVAIFDKVVAKAPQYSRARIARALANLAAGKFDAINADVTPVLAAEPQNPIGLYLRAYMMAKGGKFKEASEMLISTPRLVEVYPPARYLLAATAFASNNLEIAASNAETYVEKVPDDTNGTRLLASIYQRTGESAKAVALLEPLSARFADDKKFKLQLAEAYLGVGRSEEAIKLFQQDVDADPNNDNARLALAVSQIRAGETDKGVVELQKLIAAKPNSPQANSALILTLLQTGQTAKALETAKAMVKSDPSANAYTLQGTVQMATNDLPAARTSFNAALAKEPTYVAAALDLARVAERSNDPAGAENWYNKALAIDSKNVTAYNGLANLALAKQDTDGAVKFLERSIELNPKAVQPRLRLVALLLDRKENSRALIAARSFATDMPDDPSAIDALGRAEIANADFTNAIGSYQHLTTLFPKNAEAERRLGRAYAAAGKKDDARAAFDLAIADSPDAPAVLIDRLNLEREMKNMDQALVLAEKFVTDRPASMQRLLVLGDLQIGAQHNDAALATYRKAWAKQQDQSILQRMYVALTREGKGDEALKMLQDWSAKNPTDTNVHFMIASHLITNGKYDEALKETEAMNGALPDNPVLLNNIAWLYGMKNNPKAIVVAEKAYSLAPQSPDVADTLGWLYVTQGDPAKGVSLLGKAFAMAPKRPEIAYHYAAALKRSGDTTRAKTVLGPVLEVKATFTDRPKAEALYKELGG